MGAAGSDRSSGPLPGTAALLEASSASAVVFDREGRYRYLNGSARAHLDSILGPGAAEEALGRPWREVIPGLRGSTFHDAFDEVVATDEPRRFATRSVHAPHRFWNSRLAPVGEDFILLETADASATHAIAGDLDFLFRHFPFGAVVAFDEELRYVRVGGKGLAEVDLTAEELEGRTLHDLWSDEIVARLEGPMREALAGVDGQVVVEYGGHTYLNWVSPRYGAGGRVIGGFLLTWDITDSVRTAARLSHVGAAVGRLSVGIVVVDPVADPPAVVYANPAFCRLAGASVAEIEGEPPGFLRGPETDPDALARLRRAVREVRSDEVTIRSQRSGGEAFWNRVSVHPASDNPSSPGPVVVFHEDVSEARALQEALELQKRLGAVGQLAGGVAHDVRNVLMGVGGLLELDLERGDLPDEVRDDLEEASRVLSRASAVADRLLVFSRGAPLPRETLEVGPLLEDRGDFLRSLLRDDIRLDLELGDPDGSAWIRVDPGQLDQILLNLLSNAQDAMPRGGTIRLRLGGDDAVRTRLPEAPRDGSGRPWILLEVADDGKGMEPEVARRAVEPFYTTKGDAGGTGLGLATVYGAVTQAGGVMRLESRPGGGTRVLMGLPTADPPPPTRREEAAAALSPLQVLLAEDDSTVRSACARALRRWGHRVVEAADGDAALEVFRERGPEIDVVLTDAMMPGISGPRLVREIRRVRPGTPVILMTGYTPADLPAALEGSGASAILKKPFSLDRLRKGLSRVMNGA